MSSYTRNVVNATVLSILLLLGDDPEPNFQFIEASVPLFDSFMFEEYSDLVIDILLEQLQRQVRCIYIGW